jgi:hypothetical protein
VAFEVSSKACVKLLKAVVVNYKFNRNYITFAAVSTVGDAKRATAWSCSSSTWEGLHKHRIGYVPYTIL